MSDSRRVARSQQRPLLKLIDTEPRRLRRAMAIEKQIWMSVNQARYSQFQQAWRESFRICSSEPDFKWPLAVSFSEQHYALTDAAVRHGLPERPLDESSRRSAFEAGVGDAAELVAATNEELAQIVPPLENLLP